MRRFESCRGHTLPGAHTAGATAEGTLPGSLASALYAVCVAARVAGFAPHREDDPDGASCHRRGRLEAPSADDYLTMSWASGRFPDQQLESHDEPFTKVESSRSVPVPFVPLSQ